MKRGLVLLVAITLAGCAGAPVEKAAEDGVRAGATQGAYLGGVMAGAAIVNAIRKH